MRAKGTELRAKGLWQNIKVPLLGGVRGGLLRAKGTEHLVLK